MNGIVYTLALAAVLNVAGADLTKGGFGANRGEDAVEKSVPGRKSTPSARRGYPFHGTLESVDAGKKMIELKGKKKNRVILLAEETRFYRSGEAAKVSDAVAGERVTGTVRKNEQGQEVALTVRFGGSKE